MARFDRRIGSLEQFADAQATTGRVDDVRRIRTVNNSTQLRVGEHLIVDVQDSGETIVVRMPLFDPGKLGIESRIVVRGSGSVTLVPPPGMKVNGVTDLALTVTSTRAATTMMEDKDNYFVIQNTLDTDTDTDTGQIYVNRGYTPTTWDFDVTDFTAATGTYYGKDLSSIIGARQALVHFRIQYQGTTLGKFFVLRHPDSDLNSKNSGLARVHITNRTDDNSDIWAETNSAGYIEYRRDPTIGTSNLLIRGWFEDV